jgi:hypothetical protein
MPGLPPFLKFPPASTQVAKSSAVWLLEASG